MLHYFKKLLESSILIVKTAQISDITKIKISKEEFWELCEDQCEQNFYRMSVINNKEIPMYYNLRKALVFYSYVIHKSHTFVKNV